jgi:hypothetical protein
MVAARVRVSRGNTGGGTPLPREVFPLGSLRRGFVLPNEGDSRTYERTGQLPVVVQVTRRSRRAALCAARLVAPSPERSLTAIPWRERPPEMAAWSAKPAATDVVAHTTLKESWRRV